MFIYETSPLRGNGLESLPKSDAKPKKRFILYFDILGYKAYFNDKENDVMEFLGRTIALLDDIGEEAERALSMAKNLRYKTFSDNFFFIVDEDKQDEIVLDFLIRLAARLQLNFLTKYKITVRGAICNGDIFMDERIVFGDGLVNAVGLEEIAMYPRIIIEDKIVKTIYPMVVNNELVRKDNDDKYYVDYFAGIRVENVYQPDPKKKRYICKLRDSVFTLLNKHGHYDKRVSKPNTVEEASRVIYKYIWLLVKYNEAIKRCNLPVRINYEIVVNAKIFRMEIVNLVKSPWPIVAN